LIHFFSSFIYILHPYVMFNIQLGWIVLVL